MTPTRRHRHRQLQHARRSRRVPRRRSPHAPPAALGTIVVVDNASTRRQRRCARGAWPAVTVMALAGERRVRAPPTTARMRVVDRAARAAAQQRHARARRCDRSRWSSGSTPPARSPPGPSWSTASGRPEVSFGPMLSPLAEWRQRRRVRQAASDAAADRAAHRRLGRPSERDRRLGQRRLPARRAARRRSHAGLFDERYFMYEEDVDFCAALRARGGRILFTPQAEVRHLRGRSVRQRRRGRRPGTTIAATCGSTKNITPAGRRCCVLWLRLRGRSVR